MKKEDKSNLVDGAEEQDVANGTYTDENTPPKKIPGRTCCSWKLEGLTLVILVVVVFSLAITVAMVIHMLVGPPQVVPHGSAASGSKICSSAATSVIKKDGNGVDGAIAAALCESVTLGHLTGLGGGAMIYVYSQELRNSTLFDCREAAPASSTNDMFKGKSATATAGGTSVAIPGFLRCLYDAHKKFGSMKWSALFAPAIKAAKDGFPMPQDLHNLLTKDTRLLNLVKASPALAKAYLVNDKTPKTAGVKVKRPDLAKVMKTLVEKGADEFFKGALATDIVSTVKNAGGSIVASDLSGYKAKMPTPLRGHFNHFTIQSFPLPSVGGAFMLATLNALDSYKVYRSLLPNETSIPNQVKAPNDLYYQRLVEVMRTVLNKVNTFGSGGEANQTSDFLTSAAAKKIAESIISNSTANISGNALPPIFKLPAGDTQLSVQGPNKYLVTIASSLGSVFGSGVTTTSGIVLNNAMGAFSLPDVTPVNSANLPAAGRRPITPLTPFVAYNPRRRCGVRFAGGSAGGLEAPQVNVQLAIDALLWKVPKCPEKDCVNLAAAMLTPRVAVKDNSKEMFVEPKVPASVVTFLKNIGHIVKDTTTIGNAVLAGEVQHVVKAAADSRHGGSVSLF